MKKKSLPYVDEYKELLAKIDLSDKSINESTMQEFLEKHTALMPTPYLKIINYILIVLFLNLRLDRGILISRILQNQQ